MVIKNLKVDHQKNFIQILNKQMNINLLFKYLNYKII
jgi:hypothetical protein